MRVCTRGRALVSLDLAGAAASSDNACPVILAPKRMWPHALRGRRAPDARCAGGRARARLLGREPPGLRLSAREPARLSLCEREYSSQVFQSLSMGVLS
jgi:hypothetical protein